MKFIKSFRFVFLLFIAFAANAQYPTRSIGDLVNVNALGVADSVGVKCNINGVSFGVDLQGGPGYVFSIYEPSGSMVVFSAVDINNYIVTEGDSLSLYGTLTQARGLLFLTIDSIALRGAGYALPIPQVVNKPSESTEGKLIRINDLSLINVNDWSLTNVFARVFATNGTDTIEIIIDPDTNIGGTLPPAGKFDLIGLSSQRDDVSPFTEGYLIYPRYINDFIEQGYFAGNRLYTINTINTIDANGVLDSLGTICQLKGTVYGIDFNGNAGYDFTIIDNSGGINVRSAVNIAGYNVLEGDVLNVLGTIRQVNGYTYIDVDTLHQYLQGAPLNDLIPVAKASELTESRLATMGGFSLINPTQWPASGNDGTVLMSNGFDTLTVVIDKDTDIDGTTAPVGVLDLKGLGGQNDSSNPFTSNYYIRPRSLADLKVVSGLPTVNFVNSSSQVNENAGAYQVNLTIQSNAVVNGVLKIKVSNGTGLTSGDYSLLPSANNDTLVFTITPGMSTLSFQVNINNDALPEAAEKLTFDIVNISTGFLIGNRPVHELTIIDDDAVAIAFTNSGSSHLENTGIQSVQLQTAAALVNSETVTIRVTNGPGVTASDYSTVPGFVADTLVINLPPAASGASFLVDIIDDLLPESSEFITFQIISTSAGLTTGTNNNYLFTILDNDQSSAINIPTYSIATVRGNNLQGIADSAGVYCRLEGLVLGGDLQGGAGSLFTIYDNNFGISVFSANGFTPAYNVVQGDRVRITGTISQFNGLTQIIGDSLVLLSTGNAVASAAVVANITEAEESRLIQINKLELTNPALWPQAGTDATLNTQDQNGNIHQIRIDRDTNVPGTRAPKGKFTVRGIGTQFDNNGLPLNDGYQLIPRFSTDIIYANHNLVLPLANSIIDISGSQTDVVNIKWNASSSALGGNPSYVFAFDTVDGDFATPLLSISANNAGLDTSLTIDYATLSTQLRSLGLNIGDTISGFWNVKATNSLYEGYTTSRKVAFVRGLMTSVDNFYEKKAIAIYPNPFTQNLNIENPNGEKLLMQMYDLSGRMVLTTTISEVNTIVSTDKLQAGMYTVSLISAGEIMHYRLLKY